MRDPDHDDDNHPPSWFERLSQALLREPQDREQLIALLRDSVERKIINAEALQMIEGVLQVSDMQVRDIMVPRTQMVVVQHNAPLKDILPAIIESQHSRFPVVDDNRNEVIGLLLAKDLLRFVYSEVESFDLQPLLHPAVFIPESKRLNVLLQEFRQNRKHMAIVVDEYGSVAGLVTIEDVLEQIVGEIEDEYDVDEESEIKQIDETEFLVKAITSIEDFNAAFHTDFSDEDFDTIGGLVTHQFGHLPVRDESIQINHLNFKILNADSRRIRLLRVTLAQQK